ncbi:hypothetical protein ANCCEY_14351 [Ancylostoma ceylanicum]|uniref:THAP-type domain-containing protein n=1 Tax=Ancylostoma ceylanicum TaxID=53326 RepID=A0A0D6LA07_9BILA|nr:hypothetical protein ANCCEY_14351 [Ancylostoma ceylanicum]
MTAGDDVVLPTFTNIGEPTCASTEGSTSSTDATVIYSSIPPDINMDSMSRATKSSVVYDRGQSSICVVCHRTIADREMFLNFPDDLDRRRLWGNMLGFKYSDMLRLRDGSVVLSTGNICTDHFSEECFRVFNFNKAAIEALGMPSIVSPDVRLTPSKKWRIFEIARVNCRSSLLEPSIKWSSWTDRNVCRDKNLIQAQITPPLTPTVPSSSSSASASPVLHSSSNRPIGHKNPRRSLFFASPVKRDANGQAKPILGTRPVLQLRKPLLPSDVVKPSDNRATSEKTSNEMRRGDDEKCRTVAKIILKATSVQHQTLADALNLMSAEQEGETLSEDPALAKPLFLDNDSAPTLNASGFSFTQESCATKTRRQLESVEARLKETATFMTCLQLRYVCLEGGLCLYLIDDRQNDL